MDEGSSPTPDDVVALIEVLQGCRELAARSDNAVFSATPVADIVRSLDESVECLQSGRPIDILQLSVLFAPTGALQETSMDNEWSTEYLRHSEQFDYLIKKWHN